MIGFKIERQVMQVAEFNQFGSTQPGGSGPGSGCAHCEATLADAMDGALSAADQAVFDRHIATCELCSGMYADAQRGAALLSLLKPHRPEPSAALLERILAQTSAQTSGLANGPAAANRSDRHAPATILPHLIGGPTPAIGTAVPSAQMPAFMAKVLPFRNRFALRGLGHTMLQPRLAMTAAMAFFSIALTLNLTGVHLNQLKSSDLKPTNLKRTLYEADARAVRYYENLRVVYELESRVRDLQRANDNNDTNPPANKPAPAPQPQPKQPRPKPNSGSSQRHSPAPSALGFQLAAVCAAPLALLLGNTRNTRFNQFKQVREGGLV
jgi:hypothetical protein